MAALTVEVACEGTEPLGAIPASGGHRSPGQLGVCLPVDDVHQAQGESGCGDEDRVRREEKEASVLSTYVAIFRTTGDLVFPFAFVPSFLMSQFSVSLTSVDPLATLSPISAAVNISRCL